MATEANTERNAAPKSAPTDAAIVSTAHANRDLRIQENCPVLLFNYIRSMLPCGEAINATASTESRAPNVLTLAHSYQANATTSANRNAISALNGIEKTGPDMGLGSNTGSDSEGSRLSSSKILKDGDKGPRASTKKPQSFKPVPVNKTFQPSKVIGNGPNLSKLADKPVSIMNIPSPAGSPAPTGSRPRLVAKTGSGSSFKSGKPAAAPDPNAVWNKNRRMLLYFVIGCFFSFLNFASTNSENPTPQQPHLHRIRRV